MENILFDDLRLTESGDEAFARGRHKEALDSYLEVLSGDPGNLFAWYRTALIAGKLGRAKEAGQALALAVEALSQSGQLLLCLAAVRELKVYSEDEYSRKLRQIAMMYGAGSPRLGPERVQPPPPPRGDQGDFTMGIEVDDEQMLGDLALDACVRAAEQYRRHSSGAPNAKVPYHPLFSDLKPADLRLLVPLMGLRALPAGQVIIEQGSEGQSVFVLARGAVSVERVSEDGEARHLCTLGNGAIFGEMALLTRSPRAARVRSALPCLLLELGQRELEQLARRNPGVGEVLAGYTRDRMLRNLMAMSSLFAPLDAERKTSLMQLFERRLVPAGTAILREGETSAELHVVLSGGLLVTRKEGEEPMVVARLGPGQIAGEISMLHGTPASATVTVEYPTVLLSLERKDLFDHLHQYPEVMLHLLQVAEQRRQANQEIDSRPLVAIEEESLII